MKESSGLTRPTPAEAGGWKGYVLALLAVAIALLIRSPLGLILSHERLYITLFGGVAFAVWLARWKPAAVAAAVGFLAANYFFASDPLPITWSLLAEALVYALSAGTIIYLGERLHQDRKSTRLNSSHSQISYAV